MIKSMMNRFLALSLVVSLGVNGFFGYLAFKPSASQLPKPLEENVFPFLSKRIFALNQNDILINFTPLREELRKYIDAHNEEVSLYFEYLPSGSSIGVNDQREAKIASLIKIPIVMATYKVIEKDRDILNRTLILQEEDVNKNYGEFWKRGMGTAISTQEVIKITLIDSDNTTSQMLINKLLPDDAIDKVFDALDIPKDRDSENAIISPKNYSSILRSLYLSSYLEREHSNEILNTLSLTKFKDKLPAGVPKEIPIAHKIGVFTLEDKNQSIYSDCGIVYVPERPYIFCAMVKGTEDIARKHISLLSKMVYGYVSQVN